MQQFGVSHLKGYGFDITMDFEPDAEEKPEVHGLSDLLQRDLPPVDSVYDNPDLWPDGQKPEFTKPQTD
jgi:hypothetical protein